MPDIPERKKVGGRCGHVDLAARTLLRLVGEAEGYERCGVGVVRFIKLDCTDQDGDVGTFGKVGSVREGKGFTDNAAHAYCREKRW